MTIGPLKQSSPGKPPRGGDIWEEIQMVRNGSSRTDMGKVFLAKWTASAKALGTGQLGDYERRCCWNAVKEGEAGGTEVGEGGLCNVVQITVRDFLALPSIHSDSALWLTSSEEPSLMTLVKWVSFIFPHNTHFTWHHTLSLLGVWGCISFPSTLL